MPLNNHCRACSHSSSRGSQFSFAHFAVACSLHVILGANTSATVLFYVTAIYVTRSRSFHLLLLRLPDQLLPLQTFTRTSQIAPEIYLATSLVLHVGSLRVDKDWPHYDRERVWAFYLFLPSPLPLIVTSTLFSVRVELRQRSRSLTNFNPRHHYHPHFKNHSISGLPRFLSISSSIVMFETRTSQHNAHEFRLSPGGAGLQDEPLKTPEVSAPYRLTIFSLSLSFSLHLSLTTCKLRLPLTASPTCLSSPSRRCQRRCIAAHSSRTTSTCQA